MAVFKTIMGGTMDKSCDGKSKYFRTGQRALFGVNGHGKDC